MKLKFSDIRVWSGNDYFEIIVYDLENNNKQIGDLSFSLKEIDKSYQLGHKEVYVLPTKIKNKIDNYIYLDAILINELYQNLGIGNKLMQIFMEYCKSNFSEYPILLRANPFNNEALNISKLTRFYKSLGFKVYCKGEKSNFMIYGI